MATPLNQLSHWINAGRLDEARALANAELEQTGSSPSLMAQLALIASLSDEPEQAEAWLLQLPDIGQLQDAETVLAMGSAWFRLNKAGSAISCLARAAELSPAHPIVQARLGACLLAIGQAERALPYLQAAVALLPDSGGAALNLARGLLFCGQPEQTLAELTRSQLFTDRDEELYALTQAEALAALGRATEAESLLREAGARYGSSRTVVALTTHLAAQGQHESAEQLLRDALAAEKRAGRESVALLMQASELARVQGRYGEAQYWLEQLLTQQPENVSVWVQLTGLALQQRDEVRARTAADKALALSDNDASLGLPRAQALTAHAQVLMESAELPAAEQAFRDAITQAAWHVPAIAGLGKLLLQHGRIDEASACFHQLKRFAPAAGWSQLIQMRELPDDPAVLERMEQMALRPSLEGPVQSGLMFSLASAWERLRDADRAWAAVTTANTAVRQLIGYDPARHRAVVEREMARFSRAFVASREGAGLPSRVPVFLVGMPRSGTTLVEQILGSHSQVFGAGELSLIPELIQKLQAWEASVGSPRGYPECVDDLSDVEVARFAQGLLDKLQAMAPTAQRIVDKLPHNFEHIGLIKLLFPNATILRMCREPRDIAMSNYFMDFAARHGGMGFAYDLTWIGEQWVDHERLMDHWHEVFPGQILDIDYDALVEEPEVWARKIIAHLQLPWEPEVLAFQQLDRAVKTASVWQVRQPIYKTSKAKWLPYAAHLGPLEQALAYRPPAPMAMPLPALPPGLFFDAMAQLKQGRAVQAEAMFRELLRERPRHAAAHHFLGAALFAQKRYDEACAAMRQSLQLLPGQASWQANLQRCEQALAQVSMA